MPAIQFIGLNPALKEGARLQLADLGFALSTEGFPVRACSGNTLSVRLDSTSGEIVFPSPAAFFRGLTLLCEHWLQRPWAVKQAPLFTTLGAMVDCSRNAVPTVQTLQLLLRRMSRMGFDTLLLYTEDTYTVPQRPTFGYLRGRYTFDELHGLDAYARCLGIEMIPCIQTLGHLGRALCRPGLGDVKDTDDVMLVDSEDTYTLLEEMISAASAPFATKKIHIGMDEAYSLGRGRHLDLHGWEAPESLMRRHLTRVSGILEKHGLHGMMWSDMHFHMASGSHAGGSYPRDCKFTPELLAGAPENIDLIYWDYYTEDADYHRHILRQHKLFKADTLFAGGIFTWLGVTPDLQKTLRVGGITLEACRDCGIKGVLATVWGDDGAEGDLTRTCLYGLQAYAEYCYTGRLNMDELAPRFLATVGCEAQAFLDLDRFNQLPGLRAGKDDTVNPAKQLLYEDPLLPMFEKDFAGMVLADYYAELIERYQRYALQNPDFTLLFTLCRDLARVLSAKCALREQAALLVRSGDRQRVGEHLPPLCRAAEDAVTALADSWQAVWMDSCKPFGFEVIDLRLGGILQRLRSAEKRFTAYANGSLDEVEELTCEKLPYLLREDGAWGQLNSWSAIVTASSIG